ncbi:hypothetical protein P885DRAFT_77163 [Corynascus similis CBS 632.67]
MGVILKHAQVGPLTDTKRTYLRILECIQEHDPDISTRPRRKACDLLLMHCGACYLDAAIVRLATSEAPCDPLNNPLIDDRQMLLKVHLAELDYSVSDLLEAAQSSNLFQSPIFFAMGMASQHLRKANLDAPRILGRFRDVADAFLWAPPLRLPQDSTPAEEYRKLEWAASAIPGDYSTIHVFEGDPTLFDDGTRVHRDEPHPL